MADDFQIKIAVAADTSGAAQAGDAIEKVGKKISVLDTQAAADKEIQSTLAKATGKAVEEVGEKAEGAAGRMHKLHAALHALGEGLPGLQRLGRFLEGGFTIALGVVMLAAAAFKEMIDGLNKTVEEFSDVANEGSGAAQKIREKMDESSISAATWQHELDRTINASQSLKDATDELINRQQALITSQENVAKAQSEARSAMTDLQETLGLITKEQAIKIKLQIDEADFKAQIDARLAGIQAQINARTEQQLEAQQNASFKAPKVDAAKTAADEAAKAKLDNDAKLEAAQKNLDALKAEMKKNDDILTERAFENKAEAAFHALDTAFRERQQGQMQQQASMLNREIKQEQERAVPLGAAAAAAQSDYEAVKKSYAAAQEEAKGLGQELRKLTADLAAAKAEAAAMIPAHNAAAEARAQAALANTPTGHARRDTGDELSRDVNDAVNKARGVIVRANSGNILPSDAATLHEALDIMTELLKRHDAQIISANATLEQTKRELEQLRDQQTHSVNTHF